MCFYQLGCVFISLDVFFSLKLLSLSPDVAGSPVCPPAALDSGVELLCRLFTVWGQVGAGVLALTHWLLGDEDDGNDDRVADEAPGLVGVPSCCLSRFPFKNSDCVSEKFKNIPEGQCEMFAGH